jgi:hypothetical protein
MVQLNNHKSKLKENYIAFQSYGVRLRIVASKQGLIKEIEERLRLLLPKGFEKIPYYKAVHTFSVRQNKEYEFALFKGRKKITNGNDKEIFFKYFDSQIRLTIAEFAESRVFIHAGVVEWKGKAIILPAKSFQGKTTLVKELTKLGAKYYSDEYAVLDEHGLVHPFPKTLSIRGLAGKYQQVEFAVETFGGVKGIEPLSVGMVVLTEFEADAKWQPEFLSDGLGVMELLSHTIPIRYNPKFSLKVLNKTVNRAIIVKTKRGEAKDFALKLLSFFESKAF